MRSGSGDEPDAAVGLFRERYTAVGRCECEVHEGVPEALGRLRSLKHRLFLATSKPELHATQILAHFGLDGLFSGIHGSELDGARSDKRLLISHIPDLESLAPASAVMVGDRAQDVSGARANAVAIIGASWGYGSRAELAAAGATHFAESPAQPAGKLESSRLLPEAPLSPFGRPS